MAEKGEHGSEPSAAYGHPHQGPGRVEDLHRRRGERSCAARGLPRCRPGRVRQRIARLCEAVHRANIDRVDKGLVIDTFGNVSGIDRDMGMGMAAIKPSGMGDGQGGGRDGLSGLKCSALPFPAPPVPEAS